MNNKILFTLIILICFLENKAQSILGISTGYNFSDFFDRSKNPHYHGFYQSDEELCMGFFYKEQKNKKINLTLDLNYLEKPIYINAEFGGLGYQKTINSKYNLRFIAFSIAPNLTLLDKYLFLSIGPTIGIPIHSYNDFQNYDIRLFTNLNFLLPISKQIRLSCELIPSLGLNSISSGGRLDSINSKDMLIKLGIAKKLEHFNFKKPNQSKKKASQ